MAVPRHSPRRHGRRRKRKTSLVKWGKDGVSFLRTYLKEVTGILFLFLVIFGALYVYKHWSGP